MVCECVFVIPFTFLTGEPDPAVQAAAAAVAAVTLRPVFTLAGLCAVRPITVGSAFWQTIKEHISLTQPACICWSLSNMFHKRKCKKKQIPKTLFPCHPPYNNLKLGVNNNRTCRFYRTDKSLQIDWERRKSYQKVSLWHLVCPLVVTQTLIQSKG